MSQIFPSQYRKERKLTVSSELGAPQASGRTRSWADSSKVPTDDRMSSAAKVLLSFNVSLHTLVVTIGTIVHDIIDLGLRKRRVGLTTGFGDYRRDGKVFVRGDGKVATNMVNRRVADDKVFQTTSLDGKVVIGIAPASETGHWIIVPDGSVLQIGGI